MKIRALKLPQISFIWFLEDTIEFLDCIASCSLYKLMQEVDHFLLIIPYFQLAVRSEPFITYKILFAS